MLLHINAKALLQLSAKYGQPSVVLYDCLHDDVIARMERLLYGDDLMCPNDEHVAISAELPCLANPCWDIPCSLDALPKLLEQLALAGTAVVQASY